MAFVANIFGSFGIGGYKYNYLTQESPNQSSAEGLDMVKFCFVLDLFIVILVQVKIELFERNIDLRSDVENNVQTSQNCVAVVKNNRMTSRIVVCILCFFLCFCTYMLNLMIKSDGTIFHEIVARIVTQLLMSIIMPIFYIYQTPNLRDFCVKTLWK